MANWERRAATGNSQHQLYLYVQETAYDVNGHGAVQLYCEIGYIRVSSTSFASSGTASYDSYVANQRMNGSANFSFGSGDAVGTRRALASMYIWVGYNADDSGTLGFQIGGYGASANNSFSNASDWGTAPYYSASNLYRDSAYPATPSLVSRTDTSVKLRITQSTDWGLGNAATPNHKIRWSYNSDLSASSYITTPTTGGGVQTDHDITVDQYRTIYARTDHQGRTSNIYASSTLTIHSRPSVPSAPSLTSETQTSEQLANAAASYVGGGITGYETQLYDATGSTLLATLTGANPNFTGLTRVTAYKARQRQQNAAGWSDWSSFVDLSTPGQAPSAPSGYSAYNIASRSATISLGTISDNGGGVPTQARVKVSTTASDAGLLVTVTGSGWNPVLLTGLNQGITYYVAEAAYNSIEGGGWSAYGAWQSFTTLTNVPNAPVISISGISGANATASWVAPTSLNGATITNYKLRIARDADLTIGVRDFTLSASTLAQVIDSLNSSTQYFYQIWTETDQGRGSSSPVASFTTTGAGSSSGWYYLDVSGVPKFAEVWYNDGAGVPKLCEVWYNDATGTPKLGVS